MIQINLAILASILVFLSINHAVTTAEEIRKEEDQNPPSIKSKRFSMNFLDTLDSSDSSSWLNLGRQSKRFSHYPESSEDSYQKLLSRLNFPTSWASYNSRGPRPSWGELGLKNPVKKRFSMNFLDTLDHSDPSSWINRLKPKKKNTWLDAPSSLMKKKRFSMNYLDTIDPSDPYSWYSRINQNNRGKRFSMNFLDTLDSSDPKSWSGLSSPRSKKWSMQLRDSSLSSEKSKNPSWVNNAGRGDHDREINRKRSDEKAALDKTISEIQSMDFLISQGVERYGLAQLCRHSLWKNIIENNIFLKEFIKSDHPEVVYIKVAPQFVCNS